MPMGPEPGAGQLLVEIRDDEPGMERVSRARDRVYEAARSLEEALEPIREAAGRALASFRAIDPTTVEVELGVKLHAKTGAVLAEAGGEVHMRVTLTWEKDGRVVEP
jgi:hypothetical protein